MGRFRVLVVDDNPVVRKRSQSWLDTFGFEPVLAASAGEAKQKLAENLIHLAIVDIKLNREDPNNKEGLDICRHMDPLIPRILLTAYTDDWKVIRDSLRTDLTLTRQRLADAFLVKDDDAPEDMLKEIQRILAEEYEFVPERRIAVLTSGGDAPGMNAALWGVVRTAMDRNFEVIGVGQGYDGLIHDLMYKLRWNSVSSIMAESGTVLLSARSDDFKNDEECRKRAVRNVIDKNISGLIVIGGDGSMNGAKALADLVKEESGRSLATVAIPGTIDNDLYGTDMSLGAASAANAMIDLVRQMVTPAQALRMVFVVEVMGARSGFLALEAAIGTGADAVIIPENLIVPGTEDGSWKDNIDIAATTANLDDRIEQIYQQLTKTFAAGKRYAFVIQAEGVDKCTHDIIARDPNPEFLNSEYTEKRLKEKFASLPPNQRPAVRIQRLGYTVRGVLPSRFDVWLGAELGRAAVLELANGNTNVMVGWQEGTGITTTDFGLVVSMSNRPPGAIWQERKQWQELAALHETLTKPVESGP